MRLQAEPASDEMLRYLSNDCIVIVLERKPNEGAKFSRFNLFVFARDLFFSLIYLPFEVSFSISLGHRPRSTRSSSQSFTYQSIRCQNVSSWLSHSYLRVPPWVDTDKTCTESRSHVVGLEEEGPWKRGLSWRHHSAVIPYYRPYVPMLCFLIRPVTLH